MWSERMFLSSLQSGGHIAISTVGAKYFSFLRLVQKSVIRTGLKTCYDIHATNMSSRWDLGKMRANEFYKRLTALAVIEIGVAIAIRYTQYPIRKNMTKYLEI